MLPTSLDHSKEGKGPDSVPLLLGDDTFTFTTRPRSRSIFAMGTRRYRWIIFVLLLTLFLVISAAINPKSLLGLRGGALLDEDDRLRLDRYARVRALQEMEDSWYETNGFKQARERNTKTLERLATCLWEDSCGPGETTVILLGSMHYGNSEYGGVSGEDIWALSTIEIFATENYTMLYSYGHAETLLHYQHLHDMVPLALMDALNIEKCMQSNETSYQEVADDGVTADWQRQGHRKCAKTDDFPEGIPLWKTHALHFWRGKAHPLGEQWTLAPEDYTDELGPNEIPNYFLGYQIETHCLKAPYFPAAEREHRGLVLAKELRYFTEESNVFYHLLNPAAEQVAPGINPSTGGTVPFEMISTVGRSAKDGHPDEIDEPGVRVIGRLPREEWLEALSKGKMLVGVGQPPLSPSPYGALCNGVPFINPILEWDHENPTDRKKWNAQHNALRQYDAPYVYHVYKGDEEGLAQAMQSAVDNPIDRWIPPHMRFETVKERHMKLITNDWKAMAEAYVAENYAEGEYRWAM